MLRAFSASRLPHGGLPHQNRRFEMTPDSRPSSPGQPGQPKRVLRKIAVATAVLFAVVPLSQVHKAGVPNAPAALLYGAVVVAALTLVLQLPIGNRLLGNIQNTGNYFVAMVLEAAGYLLGLRLQSNLSVLLKKAQLYQWILISGDLTRNFNPAFCNSERY